MNEDRPIMSATKL